MAEGPSHPLKPRRRRSILLRLLDTFAFYWTGGPRVTYHLTMPPEEVLASLHGLVASLKLRGKYKDVHLTRCELRGNGFQTKLITRPDDTNYTSGVINVVPMEDGTRVEVQFPLAYGKVGTWLFILVFTLAGGLAAVRAILDPEFRAGSTNLDTVAESVFAAGLMLVVFLVILWAGGRQAIEQFDDFTPLFDAAFHGTIISSYGAFRRKSDDAAPNAEGTDRAGRV